jgi:hypothetical protein
VIPCKPLENGRVYRRFFNKHWEIIPEPQRTGFAARLPWGDWLWKLPLKGKSKVDVAGLSKWGDYYGTRISIGERWGVEGTGDPNVDLPLVVGDDYYLEVSVGDDQTGITYAAGHFLLRHQDAINTFELLTVVPPAWISNVKYGCD